MKFMPQWINLAALTSDDRPPGPGVPGDVEGEYDNLLDRLFVAFSSAEVGKSRPVFDPNEPPHSA